MTRLILLVALAVACLALPAHANRREAPPSADRFDQLADVKRKPGEPKKLIVTDRTECVLDGERVTAQVFQDAIKAAGVVLTEIAVDVTKARGKP